MTVPLPSPAQIEAFILVLLRVSAIVVLMPVFGDKVVPARIKAAMSLIVAFLIFPGLALPAIPVGTENLALTVVRMGGEVIVGVAIGFTARIIFAAVQMAGEIMGLQMGVSIANVIDPITSTQVSIVSEFLYLMAVLIFLTLDAHHIFLSAMSESYRIVPMFGVSVGGGLAREMLLMMQSIFVTGIKIAAPVMAVLLFVNVGLGIVARTVPQVNVFIVGFPLQLLAGFIFLGLSIPLLVSLLSWDFHGLARDLKRVLTLLVP